MHATEPIYVQQYVDVRLSILQSASLCSKFFCPRLISMAAHWIIGLLVFFTSLCIAKKIDVSIFRRWSRPTKISTRKFLLLMSAPLIDTLNIGPSSVLSCVLYDIL